MKCQELSYAVALLCWRDDDLTGHVELQYSCQT